MQGKANLVERVITARNDSGTRKSCAESTAQKKARLSIEKLTIHAGKNGAPAGICTSNIGVPAARETSPNTISC